MKNLLSTMLLALAFSFSASAGDHKMDKTDKVSHAEDTKEKTDNIEQEEKDKLQDKK